MLNSFHNIHGAMNMQIFEDFVAEPERPGACDAVMLVDNSFFKRRCCNKHFKSRAGRVARHGGAIEQQLIGVVVQLIPYFNRCDTAEDRWIKIRLTHQCKHTAVIRIDGNQCTAIICH